jgi:hypothetical protein
MIIDAKRISNTSAHQEDAFIYAGGPNTFTLTFTPILNSTHVSLRGVHLTQGVSDDYTISGNIVTLVAGHVLLSGDKILIEYQH